MKRIALVLAALLAAASLFAAGQTDTPQTAKEATSLVWYLPGGGTFPYPDAKEVYAALNDMFKKDLNVTVEFKIPGAFGEYNKTMPLIMAAGEKMDIIWTSSWCNNFIQAANDGLYAGLDDLLPKYAPTIWKDTKDSLEAARVNGKIMGVWSQQIAAYTSNFIVYEHHVKKYGWDVKAVKNIRQIEPFLADIKKSEPELIPLSTRGSVASWQHPYLGICGVGVLAGLLAVRVDDKQCKVFANVKDPEYVEYIKLAWDWYKKGYIAKDGLTYKNDQWAQLRANGKIAIDMHNTWKPGQEGGMDSLKQPHFQVPYGQSIQDKTNIISTLNSVSSRSKYQVDAVKLLEYMWTNKKAYNTLCWGIEGKHFTTVKPDVIKVDPKSGYYVNAPWVFSNNFNSYVFEGQDPKSFAAAYNLNQSARKATIMAFNLDLEPIKSLVASVQAVSDQYSIAVLGGYVDPDVELPKFIKALEAAGLNDVQAMVQKQIDSWLAKK